MKEETAIEIIVASSFAEDSLPASQSESTVTDKVKTRLQFALKMIVLGLFCLFGSISGFLYIAPAWRFVSNMMLMLGLFMVSSTVLAVSSYTTWGWLKAGQILFPAQETMALVPRKNWVGWRKIIEPLKRPLVFLFALVIAWVTLLPMVCFAIIVNVTYKYVGLLIFLSDAGLRVLAESEIFYRSGLRELLNKLMKGTESPSAEDLKIFRNFRADLKEGTRILAIPEEAIKQLIDTPIIDGDFKFSQTWKDAIISLVKQVQAVRKKEAVWQMHKLYSQYGPTLLALIAAAGLSFTEMYSTEKETHEFIPYKFLSIAISILVSFPVGFLQFLVERDIFTTLFRYLTTTALGISTPFWTEKFLPKTTFLRRALTILIAFFSWAHYATFLKENFSGKFLILLFCTVIPANCLLLLMGLSTLAEKFQIYRVSKGKDPENAQRAQVYYLLLKLLDTLETAEKRKTIDLIKTLELESPEERAAAPRREGVISSFCNRGSAAVSRFCGFFGRTQASPDLSMELSQPHA